MGLSYSQNKAGAYALILAQVDGPIRIPVVIGPAEAQSIAMHMEKVTPPRPLTHDLFASCNRAFGIRLKDVFIYKVQDGVFAAEMTFTDGEREVAIDARTSDAVAMAMRTGAPISTTREIMEETGFVISAEGEAVEPENSDVGSLEADTESEAPQPTDNPPLERYTVEELERTLARLIEEEKYEEAAKVSEIIRQKKNK